ncbi:MAG TPA: IPTL-CTERM sorting domain-containing protein [Thermoanaerobaculia bacterium]|nr:IPTL-CTERM sorting domain-containing protein [Thermoanaerobaculia bacterium]
MRRIVVLSLLGLLTAGLLSADVSIIERKAHKRLDKGKPGHHPHGPGATGSQSLIDSSGLKYFINTDITFSTSSSASGAASEASYTAAVAATTSAGGTMSSTLNDAFDGYEAMCVSLTGATGPCSTGSASYTMYNKNGPATTECLGSTSGVNRQVVFPVQAIGAINAQRKVFVPDNDTFARWLNYFTNTSGSPVTLTMITSNNLGSDSNTKITGSSNGDNVADLTDTWISSFQNYSGNTSSDVRLGHVLQGPGASVPVSNLFFADGNDRPFWAYTFTLQPGETKIIMNFVTGQPSKAAAGTKAAELVGLPPNALQCLSTAEKGQIANFQAAAPIIQVPTLSEVGLAALGLLLAASAVVVLRRRSAIS